LPKGTNEKAAVLIEAGSRMKVGSRIQAGGQGFYPRFYGIKYNVLD